MLLLINLLDNRIAILFFAIVQVAQRPQRYLLVVKPLLIVQGRRTGSVLHDIFSHGCDVVHSFCDGVLYGVVGEIIDAGGRGNFDLRRIQLQRFGAIEAVASPHGRPHATEQGMVSLERDYSKK